MLNEVIVMGRMTAEPELRYTSSNNIPVLTFSVAVNRDYETNGKREADFIDITAWRGTAEFVANYFRKGAMIIVIGHLQQKRWTDDDGKNHSRMIVIADRVKFGQSKRSSENRTTDHSNEYDGVVVDPATGEVIAMKEGGSSGSE